MLVFESWASQICFWCYLLCIWIDRYWVAMIFINWFRLGSIPEVWSALIGIDRHWGLIWHVLISISGIANRLLSACPLQNQGLDGVMVPGQTRLPSSMLQLEEGVHKQVSSYVPFSCQLYLPELCWDPTQAAFPFPGFRTRCTLRPWPYGLGRAPPLWGLGSSLCSP